MFRLKLKHKRAWHRHDREIEWQSREARNRACSDLCKFFISITETAKKNNKQLLDKVFKISRTIKVEVGDNTQSRRLRLITLTETLIVLDITKTDSNNCFIIHWTKKMEIMFLLLHWRQATQSVRTWHDYPQKSCTAVIHDMITRDLECPWHDYFIICSYDVTGADFKNSLYGFGQSEKR